MAIFCVKHD
jgi:hypothetical protein